MAIEMLLRRSALGLGAVLSGLTQAAGSPLDETVSVLEQWVETERKISEAQAEWEANKASMENLITIYQQEIETLQDAIAAAEADTSAAEARRADLMEQDTAVKAIESAVVESLSQTEVQVKNLQPLLPEPLQEELSPLFNSLPEDPANSQVAIGQRIQPIVAILTQVQKFNQVVTVTEGFREFEAGRTVQTEKVWFGLGTAYYVDQADEHAGLGILTEEGWQWRDDNSLIPAVRNFLNIYRGTQQASYVRLPVEVK